MTLEEDLAQFVFGLTRGASPQKSYRQLLERIFFQSEHHPNVDNLKAVSIALVAHTRDIVTGKGECALFYQLMGVLVLMSDDHPLFVPLVKELLTKTVTPTDRSPPYGSWKDIKYLLHHLREVYGEAQLVTKPLFTNIVTLLVDQLRSDSQIGDGSITLAGKWAPREKSAFGWLATHVAAACFPHLKPHSACRAYRRMLSSLNRRLDTVQVLQCERRWAAVDFDKRVTRRTLFRQRNAFGRASKMDYDRQACQRRFASHLADIDHSRTQSPAKVSVGELVRETVRKPRSVDALWDNQVPPLGCVIPFVDTSASVAGTTKEALFAAIGIGLQIAQRSAFGRRLLAFSSNVSWVNLDSASTLSSMIHQIPCEELGSNLEGAFDFFLERVAESGVNPAFMKHYTIVIISDMNFDNGYTHDDLKAQFGKAGVAMPHIVYWNVVPSNRRLLADITETNVTFLSGFQASAIRRILYKKKEGGNANTAWNKLVNMMCAPRYSWVWCVL